MILNFTTESNSDTNYQYKCFLHNDYPAWDVLQDHGRWKTEKNIISICQFQNDRLQFNRRWFTLNNDTIRGLGSLLGKYDIGVRNIHHIKADPNLDLTDLLPVVWDLCTDPSNYDVLTDESLFFDRLGLLRE